MFNKCKADSPPLHPPLHSPTIASFCISIVGLVVALAALTLAIAAVDIPVQNPKHGISTGHALPDGGGEKSGGVDKSIKTSQTRADPASLTET
jgi:hypothetical protein